MNIDDIRYRIACLEDDIACLEHEIDMGNEDACAELDETLIRLTDLQDELDNLES